MRESSKIEKTHLPLDAFEVWIGAQVLKPAVPKRPRKPSEEYYETWVRKRAEKLTKTRGPSTSRTT